MTGALDLFILVGVPSLVVIVVVVGVASVVEPVFVSVERGIGAVVGSRGRLVRSAASVGIWDLEGERVTV